MQDSETLDEQIDRLRAMAADGRDGYGKWDLSPNDRTAIAAVLAEVTRLRRLEEAARDLAAEVERVERGECTYAASHCFDRLCDFNAAAMESR